MKLQFVTIFSTIILSASAFGHGMNKHGPHGGFIRMPGAFHTEVVEKADSFHVYMLDIQFKNPTIENYQLAIFSDGNEKAIKNCSKETNYFKCEKPFKGEKAKVLTLVIGKGNQTIKANYNYPLTLM